MGDIKKGGEEFFSKKIREAKTFFQLKNGGRRLFFRKNKGGEDFFSNKKRGAKTFFSGKFFPKTRRRYPVNFDWSLIIRKIFLGQEIIYFKLVPGKWKLKVTKGRASGLNQF